MPPTFDPEKCTICGMCVEVCPGDLLVLDDTGPKGPLFRANAGTAVIANCTAKLRKTPLSTDSLSAC